MALSRARREMIVELAEGGTSLHQIAREVGCSVSTAKRVAEKGGHHLTDEIFGSEAPSSHRLASGGKPPPDSGGVAARGRAAGLEELWHQLTDRSGRVPANAKAQIVRELAKLEGWQVALEDGGIPAPMSEEERGVRLGRILAAMGRKEGLRHVEAYLADMGMGVRAVEAAEPPNEAWEVVGVSQAPDRAATG